MANVFLVCYFWITVETWYQNWSLPWNPAVCNRTARKWKVYFFYLHLTTSFQYITSVAVAAGRHGKPGTNENQGLFDCHEGWKECFPSSCSYLACFCKVLTLVNTTCWSKWPKHLMQSRHMFFVDAAAVQIISSWLNENWACIDFIHHSSWQMIL